MLGSNTIYIIFLGSKSSIEIGKFRQNYDHKNPTGIDINKRRGNDNGNDVSDDDEYECPSYILPNSYNDEGSHLVRWSSDNALSKGTLRKYYPVLYYHASILSTWET